jgi:cell division septum initiation protein DivIVA
MDAPEVNGVTNAQSESSTAIQGYSRAEVDEFLSAAASERQRLEREIADARGRIARARAALGMHRVMVAMMLETQRELGELRQNAERSAAAIVAAAERERSPLGASMTSFGVPEPAPTQIIDLDAVDHSVSWADVGGAAPASGNGSDSGDEYFDFLRGALADESPLGPISE